MWVRSEYAGEFAVLSVWLCAMLPWSVTVARGDGFWLFRIHFVYLFFQFLPGLNLGEDYVPWVFVHEAPGFPDSGAVAFGYQLWVLGAALFALPLALSVAYYAYDDRLEARAPLDPVRVMGVLLVAAAVPLTGASYFLATEMRGYSLPVGVLFMYLLGAMLLLVERT